MSFLNLLTNRIVISRATIISGNKSSYQTVTAEYGSIHRLSDMKAVGLGSSVGKVFRLYMDELADIQEEDKLVDENGFEYKVNSVTIPSDLGNFVHIEAIIELIK